jgi:hypothetical protein
MKRPQFAARSAVFVATGQRFAFAAKQRKKLTDLTRPDSARKTGP